jgi:hypothetical protein
MKVMADIAGMLKSCIMVINERRKNKGSCRCDP